MDKIYLSPIFWGCVGVALVIILVLVLRQVKKGNNNVNAKPITKISSDFIKRLISKLGDAQNIHDIKVDGGRVSVDLKEIDIVNFDEIKTMTKGGILVTENTVKMLFEYTSEELVDQIKNAIKEK